MASLESLKTRAVAKAGTTVSVIADTPIMLRLRYVGAGTVTSVTPTTATNLVTVTAEASGTVTKTYTFATYTTVGALADAINADGLFEVKVLDALRSDVTTASNIVENTAITAGVDANGIVVYDLHADTSVNKFITACLTGTRNFNTARLYKTGHRVNLQEITYFATLGGAGVNLVRVYARNGVNGAEVQVYGRKSVSATLTTLTFALGMGQISSADGAELIVRLQDGTSVADAAAELNIVGSIE